MIFWKSLWQLLFISGFVIFIYMFIIFSHRGYHELVDLLKGNDEE